MNFRALLRRAFPYIVIGIGGFALAYVVIFLFVLPTKIVPPPPRPYVPDSSQILRPIDAGSGQVVPPVEPPPVSDSITQAPPVDTTPMMTPDLIGMSLPDARGVLNTLRLGTAVTRDTSSFNPPNTVIRQSPEADSVITVGGTVTVTVSYFPPDSTRDTMRVPSPLPLGVPPAPILPSPAPRQRPDSQRVDSQRVDSRPLLPQPTGAQRVRRLLDSLRPRDTMPRPDTLHHRPS